MKSPLALKGVLEGLIQRGTKGHTSEARKLAGLIAQLVDNDEPLPAAAKQYLVGALRAIEAGESSDKAFLTLGKKGVASEYLDHRSHKLTIAFLMEQHIVENPAMSRLAASQLVEQEIGHAHDESYIRKQHREFYPEKYIGRK